MDTDIQNRGSLMTTFTNGLATCIGHMLFHEGRAFEPNGKLDLTGITEAECATHNKLLDEALVKGLDENCKIKQGGIFYYVKGQVTTFTGVLVSDNVSVQGASITFNRNGRTFRGRLTPDADCFSFKRIK
jgi:hypothetical protein